MPATEVHRRLPIVAHGDSQDIVGQKLRRNNLPRSVVPGTGVPGIVLENPVHPVIKEIVGTNPRSIVDRIAGYRHELRIYGQIDTNTDVGKPDSDTYLGFSGNRQTQHHEQHCKSVSKFHHKVLLFVDGPQHHCLPTGSAYLPPACPPHPLSCPVPLLPAQ